jgi:hypothetical protein
MALIVNLFAVGKMVQQFLKYSLLLLLLIITIISLNTNTSAQESSHNVRLPSRFGKRSNLYKFWKPCCRDDRLFRTTKNSQNQNFFEVKEEDDKIGIPFK